MPGSQLHPSRSTMSRDVSSGSRGFPSHSAAYPAVASATLGTNQPVSWQCCEPLVTNVYSTADPLAPVPYRRHFTEQQPAQPSEEDN